MCSHRIFAFFSHHEAVRFVFANEITELADALKRLRRALDLRTKALKNTQDILEGVNVRNKAIFASASDAIIVLDQNLRFTIMNPVAEQLVGTAGTALLWQSFESFFPHFYNEQNELVPREHWPYSASVAQNTVITTRGFLERKDAKRFAVRISAAPMVREGVLVGVVVSLHDITEELKAEESLREFVSIASHQLRGPLASILWFLELVMAGDSGQVSSKQWEFLYQSYQAAERMRSVINLLLSVSRIETGRLEIRPVAQNLAELIGEIASSMKVFADRKKQKLDVDYAKSLPENVPLDRNLFTIVLENLLTNAIRYTPNGGVITVKAVAQGDEVVISVKDNGLGIPEEEKKRIFSKFFRAENVVLVSPEGSGLGLYIVKQIVELWSGKVWFQSEEGKGATFFFTVPLAGMRPTNLSTAS